MAASTTFVATLRGRGGHAAFPPGRHLPPQTPHVAIRNFGVGVLAAGGPRGGGRGVRGGAADAGEPRGGPGHGGRRGLRHTLSHASGLHGAQRDAGRGAVGGRSRADMRRRRGDGPWVG